MTAPDRIWLQPDIEWRRCQICKHSGGQQMAFDHGFPDSIEYLRKGAFPVGEIREACEGPVYDSELSDLLERILSLLEGDADEQL